MATADEIAEVRRNTNEPDDTGGFTDALIGTLVDTLGLVSLASGAVWRTKAAKYADLVDVSEAGASRKMSDLFKHATAMADHWDAVGATEIEDTTSPGIGRAVVHPIVRTT
jgi:hypothetical protein